jgi:Cu+-exporting ATPase
MSQFNRAFLPSLSGMLAAMAMLGIYFITLTLVSGWSFTLSQFRESWPYVVALAAGFGAQIGLFVHLKQIHARHDGARRAVAASGTASTAAMLACCTHYLANLVPIIGMAGVITFVAQYQIELFWLGLAFNAAGLAYIATQVSRSQRHTMQGHAL